MSEPLQFAGLPLAIKANPRAKRVLVKLVPGRGLEVVTPRRFDPSLVRPILEEKRAWIERTRDRMVAAGTDLFGAAPELPDVIEYLAWERTVRVDYLDRPGAIRLVENAARWQVAGPLADREPILEKLRAHTVKKAREVLLPWLDRASQQTGMKYSALRVRRQKTRWGSCSSRGTISLNAKLLFLPPRLVDHLLLHELCHTRHMNHSPAYWACVAGFEPDYQRLENEVSRGNRYVPAWFR
ncbi:SprT family zinc-dependent metalloprotease [uncultured Pseudodesulfovibrio sp.]|uniref:M48 family metallopeptidase n=1 Tax=uncultured Pseudodesulfovibrio sp. TaxID=2035858 RepID=UPI0029C93916|nr:SprT family zinc-dependent metalloprotease [uncultured Pseudodesulfovibrio sp.]